MTNPTQPMPEELEERLDDLMAGGAKPPDAATDDDTYLSTNPNEAEGEHEPLAVAESDHQNEPSEQQGGGQSGG
jgi:hypothetical protein